MTEARSEDSYIIHDIITAFAHYGYPQAGDHQNLKIKGDVKIRIGSRMLEPDVIYYASGIPLLLVEDKKPNQSEEGARDQAFSYLKVFPVEKYSRDNIRPKYLATTVGRQIKVYKYHYEIDERGELIETPVILSEIPTYEELKKQYGIIEEEKPKLTPDSFKDLFYELASALDISEENKITPELILKVVRLIYEYLKDSQNYVSRVPYVELDGHPDRQQWVRNILSQYSWQDSLGSDLASQFRIEILRSFQGAGLNQYITPKSVVDFMVGFCGVSPEDKILDFECGSGGFIAAAISQNVPMENVLGIDVADLPYYVAKTYLALYFSVTGGVVENIPIRLDNGLYFWRNDWDVVIGNPAGGSQYDPQGELGDLEKVLGNLERDLDQNGRDDPFSEYNFSIQQAVRSCKVGGRICLILPEGFFTNSTDEFLRKYVTRHCKIKAIISLPRGVFRKGTTTKTVVSGSQASSQKMSILFAEKIKEVKNSSGLDVSTDQLSYPVFLAGVQKPEGVGSDPDEWLEPLLGEVLKEWRIWEESKSLSPDEATLDIGEPESKKKEKLLKFQKARQEHLIKPEAPLLDIADQPAPKPKTKKETVIPENLEELFDEASTVPDKNKTNPQPTNDKTFRETAEEYMELGCEVYSKGDSEINEEADKYYEKAINCLEKIEKKSPEDYHQLGILNCWVRKYTEAFENLERAIRDAGDSMLEGQAKYWKAITLHEGFGKNKQAVEIFENCLKDSQSLMGKISIINWLLCIALSEPNRDERVDSWANQFIKLVREGLEDPKRSSLGKTVLGATVKNRIRFFVVRMACGQIKYPESALSIADLGLELYEEDDFIKANEAFVLWDLGKKKEAREVVETIDLARLDINPYGLKKLENIRSEKSV